MKIIYVKLINSGRVFFLVIIIARNEKNISASIENLLRNNFLNQKEKLHVKFCFSEEIIFNYNFRNAKSETVPSWK